MSGETATLFELELHPSLWACVESCGRAELEQRIGARVAETLRGVGISRTPATDLRPVDGERAVRAFIGGAEKAFPPSFLARLWFGIAPGDLLEDAFDPALAGKDGGHAWLVAASTRIAADGRADGSRTVCDLVEHLAVEIVSLHPAGLLDQQEAAEYLGLDGTGLSPADAASVLQRLLDLGVSLCARERTRRLVLGATALEQSTVDVFEETFTALRAREIEVHLDGHSFDGLVGGAPDERVPLDDGRLDPILVEAMTLVRAVRLSGLGADLPVVLVRAGDTRDCEMRIKMNDRLAPPVPLPAPGEVGVSAPPSVLERYGVRARGLVDPVTGAHLSAVAEERSSELVEAGEVPVLPSAYLAAAFGRTVTALAYRLIAVDRVEEMLARFEQLFPVLVHAALARYRIAEVTGLLRELVRERVPIDDLWRILNALVVFDEVEAPALPGDERLDAALARVRLELADRIVINSCGLQELEGGEAIVYQTDPALDELVESWRQAPATNEAVRAARTAVWRTVGRAGDSSEPVIVTSSEARPLLRRALNQELPDAHVLARSELPPEVNVEPAGVIAVA